ncbi:MAG: N-acetyl sugar amidotransferase [Candidatus Omnitrophota bacterium]
MIIDEVLDRQLDVQSDKVFFCTRCVNSNLRPRLKFNEKGECDACQYAHEKEHTIDWKARENELLTLLGKHRSKNGSYDVVVPASGGKDSSYVAHQLKHIYGMHPLTVTWTPHMYTDIGWKNLQSMIDAGFDNILFRPSGLLHRKISKLALELLGDSFEGWAYGAKAYPLHMAIKHRVPLVFYGENQMAEYGGVVESKYRSHDNFTEWDKIVYKGQRGIETLIEKGLEYGRLTKEEVKDSAATLALYKLPPIADIQKIGLESHWFSYYKKWMPQENYYYAQKHCGFEPNPDGRSEGTYSKYASLDDKTDGFHFYMQFIKFGFGRCTSEAAMEIRCGHITREEGVALVRKYDGEFPGKYFKEYLEYLNITEDEFRRIVDKFRNRDVFKKVNGEWKLKYQVE